jgi:eukaryotic-like serine/threonine-protein kinase
MSSPRVLADRYELGERLGVGGMSTVVLGFDRRLEREVAIKLLAEHLADDSQFVARFRREARSAARLIHPNIVQVFDFGLDDHRHYIVMELVRGHSAAELLRDRGALELREALSIVAQSCRGLEYAHRNGVVHRDVKPGNLLRGEDDVVKLADFGIAKALSDESTITQVGSVLGTAAYLAPEQAAGETAGPPADIYALGVVTYQLISGRLPYQAQSLTELAIKQRTESPPRLDDLDPHIPAPLAVAVDSALAMDPEDRPPTADALRKQLADGARGVGPTSTSRTRVAGPPTTATTVRAPTTAAAPSVARPQVEARQPRAPRAGRPAPAPPARAPVPASAAAARRAARRPGRARRGFGIFLVLLLLAAGGAAAVIATSSSDSAVRLRRVVYDDVQKGVDQLQQLVNDNTK